MGKGRHEEQLIDRIMRKLDMRVVRASNLDRMFAQIQALQAELQQLRAQLERVQHENAILRTRADDADRENEICAPG